MPLNRDAKLELADKNRLRKLRAKVGETRTARLLSTSKTTVDMLLFDGGVLIITRDRIATLLRRMTMPEFDMTEEDMIAAIEAETPLKADDIKGLRKCSAAEMKFLVQGYWDLGLIRDMSTWEKIGGFLKRCSDYAAVAAPLLSVASFIIAL
jgi:hypothetical protein